MKFIIGSDDASPVLGHVAQLLRDRGHEVVAVVVKAWGEVALEVAHAVASKTADQGVVMCWTGTGVAMAAAKVPGVRAALCVDAATAAGARKWNDANVLVMGLRLTSEEVAREMLDAWFSTAADPGEAANIARLDGPAG